MFGRKLRGHGTNNFLKWLWRSFCLFSACLTVLFKNIYIYLLTFGCAGSSLLCGLFSSCGDWGLLSSCSAWASHCSGFLQNRRLQDKRASVVVAPRLWGTGSVVTHRLGCMRHVGYFQIRDRIGVSWTGRWIPYHRAVREALLNRSYKPALIMQARAASIAMLVILNS